MRKDGRLVDRLECPECHLDVQLLDDVCPQCGADSPMRICRWAGYVMLGVVMFNGTLVFT